MDEDKLIMAAKLRRNEAELAKIRKLLEELDAKDSSTPVDISTSQQSDRLRSAEEQD